MIQEFEHGLLVPLTRKGRAAFSAIDDATAQAANKFGVSRADIVVSVALGRQLGGLVAVGTEASLTAWAASLPFPPSP